MSADLEAVRSAFAREFSREPALLAEAPGRVNLIGEHTDYNDGFVLPVAIDRTVAVAGAPRDDPMVHAIALDFNERDEFPAECIEHSEARGWRDYLRGVAWALRTAGHPLAGADLAITGDVPRGAGLSSSAAFEVAIAGALAAVSGARLEPRELALAGCRAENDFVGVESGIMDQMAAALGREGHALLIDCRSLAVDCLLLPDDVAVAVVDSGVAREVTATAYNERRRQCEDAAELLGVRSLRDADETLLHALGDRLTPELYRRARHVICENARTVAAADALRAGDLGAFGRLMCRSHESLRDDFEVSTPELDLLVELARGTDGVLGARLTGAGFGGCTVNLVRRDAIDAFRASVVGGYEKKSGRRARMHVCRAVDGLRVTPLS